MKKRESTGMNRDAMKYYIRQAFKSLKKNKLTTAASISTTAATLFILGVLLAFSMNVSDMARQFSRDCEIQVFINENADAEQYDKIGEKISKIQYVSSVEKFTKEQILEYNIEKLGDKAVILEGFEEDNPFRDSFKVQLTDLSYTAEVVKSIKKLHGVENVTDFQEAAGYIMKFTNTVNNVSVWVMIIFCIVTAFIVSNAVKVSVYARRKEINIMKYVGATDWFIRWPFVVEGIVIGIYGALIAFCAVALLYWQVYRNFSFQDLQMLAFGQIWWMLLVSFAVVGIVIGSAGSGISIRKHLKV